MMDVKDLTLAGWALIVMTVLSALGLGTPVLMILSESLSEGRYPRLLFLLPTIVIGLVVYFVGSKVFNALGKPIRRHRT